jgi:hypothetical protein
MNRDWRAEVDKNFFNFANNFLKIWLPLREAALDMPEASANESRGWGHSLYNKRTR